MKAQRGNEEKDTRGSESVGRAGHGDSCHAEGQLEKPRKRQSRHSPKADSDNIRDRGPTNRRPRCSQRGRGQRSRSKSRNVGGRRRGHANRRPACSLKSWELHARWSGGHADSPSPAKLRRGGRLSQGVKGIICPSLEMITAPRDCESGGGGQAYRILEEARLHTVQTSRSWALQASRSWALSPRGPLHSAPLHR